MSNMRLSTEEREMCALVARAGTVNHFSDERRRCDRALAGLGPTAAPKAVITGAIARLNTFVSKLEAAGRADLRRFDGDDRHLLRLTLLFALFHELMSRFDEHILRQLDGGDEPLPVAFADTALERFARFGFPRKEALLYFAIFFQLRRAYYFIESRIAGTSPGMVALREELWNNVFTHDQLFYGDKLIGRMEDFSTIILGPTGTGKGTAAAAIGSSGFIPFNPERGRFDESFTRAFVSLNLTAFSENLVESELFGHRKGAFTGAMEAHEGVFSRCSPHGSIFLDEIGDVSLSLQTKLLRVLQERTFAPVGSHERRRFSGRVIAATNRDLSALRRAGRFRDDFYYRLCSDTITVPPLCQRLAEDPGELRVLVAHVTGRIVGAVEDELIERMCRTIHSCLGESYHWPGNVRELEQCVRAIIIRGRCTGDFAHRGTDGSERALLALADEGIDTDSLLARYCRALYKRHRSYSRVGTIAGLDRRTVKKYIENTT
jgi:hypothetical protein